MPSKENSISTKEPASSPEAKLTALGKSLIKAAKPEIAAKALDILAEAKLRAICRKIVFSKGYSTAAVAESMRFMAIIHAFKPLFMTELSITILDYLLEEHAPQEDFARYDFPWPSLKGVDIRFSQSPAKVEAPTPMVFPEPTLPLPHELAKESYILVPTPTGGDAHIQMKCNRFFRAQAPVPTPKPALSQYYYINGRIILDAACYPIINILLEGRNDLKIREFRTALLIVLPKSQMEHQTQYRPLNNWEHTALLAFKNLSAEDFLSAAERAGETYEFAESHFQELAQFCLSQRIPVKDAFDVVVGTGDVLQAFSL